MIKKYIKFFLFACLCFIIADVFVKADERDSFIVPSGAQFYDNNNGSLTAITTDFINNAGDNFYMSSSVHTIPNSSGAAIGFNLNEPLISGYVYTISVSVGPIGCGETRLSSINRIGVGGSYNTAKTNYQNGGNSTIKFSDYQVAGQGYKGISYAFVPNTNGTYIVLPYTTANNCSDVNYFYGYTISNLGSANNVSQQDINNSINNQTTIIQNQINNMSEDINSTINDNFNDCEPEENISFSTTNGYALTGYGEIVLNDKWLVTSYIPVKYGYSYTQSGFTSLFVETYDSNHNKISSFRQETFTITDSNVNYIRLNSKIEGYSGKIIQNKKCTNKIDKTNEELGDINDSMNNSDTTGAQDSAGGFFSDFTTDTHGLTAIITAPLSLIESITSSSCSPLVIPLPYVDKDLTLPCMGTIYSNYFGSFLSIYQIITFGIVAYWVLVRIFNLVKDFKNPDHDEIEVLDL